MTDPASPPGTQQGLRRLQAFTARLAAAVTPGDLVRATLAEWTAPDTTPVLALLDQDGILQVHAAGEPLPVPLPLRPGHPLADAILSGQALTVPGAASPAGAGPGSSNTATTWTVAPVRADNEPAGSVAIIGPASDSSAVLLEAAAAVIGGALTRMRLYERERTARQDAERAIRELRALTSLTSNLATAASPADVAAATVDAVIQATGATDGAVALCDGPHAQLIAASSTAGAFSRVLSASLEDIASPCGIVVQSAEPLWLGSGSDAYSRFPAAFEDDPAAPAWCIVPLAMDGMVRALLLLRFPSPAAFPQDQRDLVQAFGEKAAQALDRSRLLDVEHQLRVASEESNAALTRAIEQRDQALNEAAAESTRLRQILDVLPEGILIVDTQGQPLLANQAATLLWGDGGPNSLQALDDLGQPFAIEDLPLRQAVATGQAIRGVRMALDRPGEAASIVVLVSAAPLHDPAGTITGAVAVVQDITHWHALDEARAQLIQSASHDLKTPLTIITLAAGHLRRACQDQAQTDPIIAAALEDITASATDMQRLIEDMLESAALRAGREILLHPEPADLAELVRESIRRAGTLAAPRGIRIEAALEPATGAWDIARVGRVLDNLLVNAIKYSPAGASVDVTLATREDHALITVTDHGLGIPPDELDLVFRPFSRARNVSGRFAGSGFGLAGALQIVRLHGGDITVRSTQGRGSTFTVRLPLTLPGTAPPSP